jgi:hypothetical protein
LFSFPYKQQISENAGNLVLKINLNKTDKMAELCEKIEKNVPPFDCVKDYTISHSTLEGKLILILLFFVLKKEVFLSFFLFCCFLCLCLMVKDYTISRSTLEAINIVGFVYF